MLKTISVLLLSALFMPSAVMAQSPAVPSEQPARTWILRSKPSSREQHPLFGPVRVRLATAHSEQTSSDTQPEERSWAGRHPAALGAIIGAVGGALIGAAPCWREVCGDGHGPLLVGAGAAIGAGVGAGVGFTISLTRR